jgi:hypothetical protein
LATAPEGVVGNQKIADAVENALRGVTTVHQIHFPEIELISDDTATGIWPLNDILTWEKDGKRNWMRAHGHYRQTYRKIGGRWLISEHHLTRLLVEQGSEALA